VELWGRERAAAVLQSLGGKHRATARCRWCGAIIALAILLAAAAGAVQGRLLIHVSEALGAPLERRFERLALADPGEVTGLLVLGGGEERLLEAGRLARLYPHLKLHISGAGEPDYVLRALGAGIEPQRVAIETVSRTTFENAVNSRLIVDPKPGERWLLVTSAIHMPRSMGAFRKSGFWPEPWPVDDGMAKAPEQVAHEWMGLLWYWISGRGNSLFPGPLQ
jgi:uncharacterized SAM-binding protein YcdF (DUF218 family)